MFSIINSKLKKILKNGLVILFHNLVLTIVITFIIGISFMQYVGVLNGILYYEIQVWKLIMLCAIIGTSYYFSYKRKCDVTLFGLLWKITLFGSRMKSPRGPFCPDCDCNISHTFIPELSNFLICPKCQKSYEINTTSIENIRTDVKEIIETDLKSNTTLDYQFLFNSIDDIDLWVENKGAFVVQDLSIVISLNTKDEDKKIWEHFIATLVPQLKQQIVDKDLNDNLRKELENTGLIKIYYLGCLDIRDNGYREEIIDVGEYHLSLKEEFDITLTITAKYSIINKKKCVDTKYLIQFRKHAFDGSTERYPNDDCLISVNKIK